MSDDNDCAELTRQVARLEQRLLRERTARLEAERIAEQGTRQLYERSRHLELLEAVAVRANQGHELHSTLAYVLHQICEFCDWPVGHLMWPTEAGGARLVSSGLFHAATDGHYDAFRAASLDVVLEGGEGLPGRVWKAKRALWLTDVSTDPNFPRAPIAAACDLHAGFGCPVLLGDDVAMVLEFFSFRRLEPDAALLHTLGQICAQLARVVERDRSETRLRAYNTELQNLVETAERERAAAEAANAAKSVFLANMSHEIRTPLNGLLGMVQVMGFNELPVPQRERLNIVQQSGEALLAILNDILDLSKVEAGRMELEAVDFDLTELLHGVHAAFLPLAQRKDIGLELRLPSGSPDWRVGDRTRIRQILHNLLANAIKFTERGDVRLEMYDDGVGRVRFAIADTGIGIAPEQLARIFDEFAQADSGVTRRFGGTGLGLSICRELAALMGGGVSVESVPGQGSVFTLELGLERRASPEPAPAEAPPESEPALDGALQVLAAEDNAVNQLVLKALLSSFGIDPTVVENGEEAVEAWRSGRFDLVLMDIQMPVMDGVTAASRIRAAETGRRGPRTPILALTANTMSHQVEEYLAVGMDGVIAKPIDAAVLHAEIARALELSEASAAA